MRFSSITITFLSALNISFLYNNKMRTAKDLTKPKAIWKKSYLKVCVEPTLKSSVHSGSQGAGLLYCSSRLCKKVFGNPCLALQQLHSFRCFSFWKNTSLCLRSLMAKSSCGINPLPESLQMRSSELQECKTSCKWLFTGCEGD